MKTILACSLIAVSLTGAAPAFAQGYADGPRYEDGGSSRYRTYERDPRDMYRPSPDDVGRSVYRQRGYQPDRDENEDD